MKILGIETSCDETAAAVVENGVNILSNVVVSQIDIFAEYGGVIPEVAARSHLEAMLPVVNKALKDANCTWDDIDAIAVTHAPGLLGSLLVGTLTARTLAILHNKPLYAVHHLKSHIYANWLSDESSLRDRSAFRSAAARELAPAAHGDGPAGRGDTVLKEASESFPVLAMVISGGHTQILYMPRHNDFKIIGTTEDDAIGECFDKVAKILGLPYPGGPAISREALKGNRNKYALPHPHVKDLNFSFSGLKTAVLRAVQKEAGLPISHPSSDLKNHLTEAEIADFAASFEKTAVDILIEKLKLAQKQYPDAKSIVFAGGVSANTYLREVAKNAFNTPVLFPEPKFSGDNGAMVAAAAYFEIESGVKPTEPYKLNIYPRIEIA